MDNPHTIISSSLLQFNMDPVDFVIKQKKHNSDLQIIYPKLVLPLQDLDQLDPILIRAVAIPVMNDMRSYYTSEQITNIKTIIQASNPNWFHYPILVKDVNRIKGCVVLLDQFGIPIHIHRFEKNLQQKNEYVISYWKAYEFDCYMRPIKFNWADPIYKFDKKEPGFLDRMWQGSILKQPPSKKLLAQSIQELQTNLHEYHLSKIIMYRLANTSFDIISKKIGISESDLMKHLQSEFYEDSILYLITTQHRLQNTIRQYIKRYSKIQNNKSIIVAMISDILGVSFFRIERTLLEMGLIK